ncbi:MAG: hypothetical protein ACD_79C00561G0002 [uncultured bacterium]|nr:MAG: hypothetical protein ACD_79C00561G0002 [uncultured bacterium]
MIKNLFISPPSFVFKKIGVCACYLFGSKNTKDFNEKSDYDLAIFVKSKQAIDYRSVLKQVLNIFKYPEKLHLSIVDLENTSPIFLYQVIKNSTLIYEYKNNYYVTLESMIMRLYFDDQYRNNIYFKFLKQKYANR